jgi:high-affinity Fe2+/Pb2+ permease
MEVIDWLKLILAGIVISIAVALLIGWALFRTVKGDRHD